MWTDMVYVYQYWKTKDPDCQTWKKAVSEGFCISIIEITVCLNNFNINWKSTDKVEDKLIHWRCAKQGLYMNELK